MILRLACFFGKFFSPSFVNISGSNRFIRTFGNLIHVKKQRQKKNKKVEQ